MEDKHRNMFFEMDYGKDVKLDLKDKKILAALGENCRMSVKQLGKTANIGKDSVRYRINQLIKKDIYRGDVAMLNPFAAGLLMHSILLKLEKLSPRREREIKTYFENHPFISWVGQTQGTYDYNLIMASEDTRHFDELLRKLKLFIEEIKDYKVMNITKMYVCNTLPMAFRKEAKADIHFDKLDTSFGSLMKQPYCSEEGGKVGIDKIDILVIGTMANDARLSLQEISKKTGLKPDTVKYRIADLIKRNVILAFRGSINLSFLRFHGYYMFFRLHPHARKSQREEFENYFKVQDYALFAFEALASPYDFQISVVAKDPYDFNRILNDIRNKFSPIIEEYDSVLILNDFKFTSLPEGVLGSLKKLFLKAIVKFKG